MAKQPTKPNTAEPQDGGMATSVEASQAGGADSTAADSAASAGGAVTSPRDTSPSAADALMDEIAAKLPFVVEAAVKAAVLPVEERLAALEANSHPPVDHAPAIEAGMNAYLDANLEELVKAAMPPTPEQQAKIERETLEESMRKAQAAAARRQKREAAETAKLAEAAAAEQAKRDAAAAKAFAEATPFVGELEDLSDKIIREIRIDDGMAYSADLIFPVRLGDFIPLTSGELLLNKPLDLPSTGRAFDVRGVSLLTDAGRMRIAVLGSRTCGAGKAVHFPAKALVFSPHSQEPAQTAE